MSKSTRKIKIQPRVTGNKHSRYLRPELRISGKWLQEYGFGINDQVTIVCEPKKLTIVLLDHTQ